MSVELTPEQEELVRLRLARDAESNAVRRGEEIVVPLRAGGDGLPFFCVHSPLGSTGYYASLAREMPAEIPFFGINSPGLFGDRPPLRTFEEMAATYLEAVRRVRPEGPYVFGGHCSGGYIAFEMCLQLGAAEAPACVVIDQDGPAYAGEMAVGQPGPEDVGSEDGDPEGGDDALSRSLITLLSVIASLYGRPLPAAPDAMRQALAELDEGEQIQQIHDWLVQLRFLPASATVDQAVAFLEVAGANSAAELLWSPGERLYAGRLGVLQATESFFLPGVDIEVVPSPEKFATWQRHCRRPVEHFEVPGNHNTLMTSPNVCHVASSIASFLETEG